MMQKVRAHVVYLLFALFAIPALSFVADTAYASTNLGFVGSDEELNIAVKAVEKGAIGGIAINQDFYLASSKQTKDRIRGLVAGMLGLNDRSVYVYGKPLDTVLAGELLNLSNYTSCSSAYFWGRRETATERTWSCWSGNETMTDSEIREYITLYNRYRAN